jgi:hypothetical protein
MAPPQQGQVQPNMTNMRPQQGQDPRQMQIQPNQQQMRPQQQHYGQPRGNQPANQNAFIDYQKISDIPSKYPRVELAESLEDNMELGGSYQ